MSLRKVLVAGALGVVGRAVVMRLAARADCRVVALSRRAPDPALRLALGSAPNPVEWIACDLADAEETRRALGRCTDATHLVYAALYEKPDLVRGWFELDHVARNVAMLRNVFAALSDAPLEHVALLQGTKAYGAHFGEAMRVPAREGDEVRDARTFYFAQQDLLEAEAARRGFAFTLFRPQIVLGVAVGSAMNLVAALGAYAAVLREQGRPLAFPGSPHALAECVDARLVASAVEWSWTAKAAHGEAINLANGDVVVWRTLFERVARALEMPMVDAPIRFAVEMPECASAWRRIAAREGLHVPELEALIGLSWQYADVLWGNVAAPALPSLVSTIKARRLGFGDCFDTEEGVLEHLAAMRAGGYLPSFRPSR